MNIPKEIRQKRRQLKESQAQFAKRFGVSHSQVSYWESGENRAPYKVIYFCHTCKEK